MSVGDSEQIRLEKALLGAALYIPRAVPVLRTIPRSSFTGEAHQEIYDAIARLDEQEKAVDLVSVLDELHAAGALDRCGGPTYLSSLIDGVPRALDFQSAAQRLTEATRKAPVK